MSCHVLIAQNGRLEGRKGARARKGPCLIPLSKQEAHQCTVVAEEEAWSVDTLEDYQGAGLGRKAVLGIDLRERERRIQLVLSFTLTDIGQRVDEFMESPFFCSFFKQDC